jgi:hypothetical protein
MLDVFPNLLRYTPLETFTGYGFGSQPAIKREFPWIEAGYDIYHLNSRMKNAKI